MSDKRQTDDPMSAVLILNPIDNVVVCRCDVRSGDVLRIGETEVAARADVALGHKIALAKIPTGMPVIKYGMAIGVSTADILPGDWVHMHNMKSSYISSHTRQSRTQP